MGAGGGGGEEARSSSGGVIGEAELEELHVLVRRALPAASSVTGDSGTQVDGEVAVASGGPDNSGMLEACEGEPESGMQRSGSRSRACMILSTVVRIPV